MDQEWRLLSVSVSDLAKVYLKAEAVKKKNTGKKVRTTYSFVAYYQRFQSIPPEELEELISACNVQDTASSEPYNNICFLTPTCGCVVSFARATEYKIATALAWHHFARSIRRLWMASWWHTTWVRQSSGTGSWRTLRLKQDSWSAGQSNPALNRYVYIPTHTEIKGFTNSERRPYLSG